MTFSIHLVVVHNSRVPLSHPSRTRVDFHLRPFGAFQMHMDDGDVIEVCSVKGREFLDFPLEISWAFQGRQCWRNWSGRAVFYRLLFHSSSYLKSDTLCSVKSSLSSLYHNERYFNTTMSILFFSWQFKCSTVSLMRNHRWNYWSYSWKERRWGRCWQRCKAKRQKPQLSNIETSALLVSIISHTWTHLINP